MDRQNKIGILVQNITSFRNAQKNTEVSDGII